MARVAIRNLLGGRLRLLPYSSPCLFAPSGGRARTMRIASPIGRSPKLFVNTNFEAVYPRATIGCWQDARARVYSCP